MADDQNKSCCYAGHKFVAPVMAIILILLGIYLVALVRNAWKAYDYVGKMAGQTYTISISGEGKVTAIPDIAKVELGITTEKTKVADAQKENTEKMNSLIKELKGMDIEAKDIATSNYSIYPKYDWTSGRQILLGYTVTQNVTVKIRDLEKVGSILDVAGKLGVNQAGGLSFTIDEPEKLKQQAREEALQNAKEKADALAKIAGVKIGKVVSFTESGSNEIYPIYREYTMKALDSAVAGSAPSPTVEPGSQDIVIDVSVTYEVL